MAKIDIPIFDRTLSEIDKLIEAQKNIEPKRKYLGMSEIGHECWRKLFYSFRYAERKSIPASGAKAIEDGYLQEDVMAQRLRMIPTVELITKDPDNPDKQIEFSLLLGHFKGHCDGIIKGILEAPQTWHVWEHKSVNQEKFDKLKKIRNEKGEKEALKDWDIVYYVQAQIYMHQTQLERHFLTVTSPGGRDHVSIRTEYNKKYAEDIITKAQSIIFDNWNLPARLSDKREFYQCKWCEYQSICHDGDFPLVHCKTCRYWEPIKDGQNQCVLMEEIIEDEKLFNPECTKHVYNPALIGAKLLEHQEQGVLYEIPKSKIIFFNSEVSGIPKLETKRVDAIYNSRDLRDKIKSIQNITKETIMVQQEFCGEIDASSEKAWEANKIIDKRLKK